MGRITNTTNNRPRKRRNSIFERPKRKGYPVGALQKIRQILKKDLVTDESLGHPFKSEGLSYHSPLGEGQQEKAQYTAFYGDVKNVVVSREYAIKRSQDYPADDIAEVVTSSLLVKIIGEDNAVPYTFIKSTNDGIYLKSDVRNNFKDLEGIFKSKFKKTKGWLASNPRTDENKDKIHACFTSKQLKKDMANVLAGCLLVLDVDCQVKNICFYTDGQNTTRIAKFDDGWGLAEICKPKNAKVDLFEHLSMFGTRATHKKAGLPTNHFIDYPYILHSIAFVDSLQAVGQKAKSNIDKDVQTALEKIDNAYPDQPTELMKAYKKFAAHLGIKLKSNVSTEQIKNTIQSELSKALTSRAESMLVLSEVLKIKVQIDEGSAEINTDALISVLKKHGGDPRPNLQKLMDDFQKAGAPPFLKNKEKLSTRLNFAALSAMCLISPQAASSSSSSSSSLSSSSSSSPSLAAAPAILPSGQMQFRASRVMTEANNNVTTLASFLAQTKKEEKLITQYSIASYQCVSVSGSNTKSLELSFQDSESKAYIRPTLPSSSEQGGVTYSIDNGLSLAAEKQIIKNLCKLAVDAALTTPQAEFDLTNTPTEKREITKKALIEAIEANKKEFELYTGNNPALIIKAQGQILYSSHVSHMPVKKP